MGIRNKRPDLNGVLVIDKPLGWSSAKVCSYVRRVTNGAKVGHAGTLDPLATGVLVLCLGKATKGIAGIQDGEKAYEATIDLSAFSTTDDAEGERDEVEVSIPPTLQTIRQACDALTGTIQQVPPAFSAIKVDGKRAYKSARAGESVELKARPVVVHSIDIETYAWPELRLTIRCGKGTYIRSIARDLGKALSTGGMLTELRRTRVGTYGIGEARVPEDLPDPLECGHLQPSAAI